MLPCAGVVFKPIGGMPPIGFFGELDRRRPAVGGVRPVVVVIKLPGGQDGPGVRQGGEQRLVQAFVTQPPVEAFDEAVLLRLARRDVMPVDPAILRPLEDRHAGQLGAVVADHGQRRAASADDGVQLPRHAGAGQRRIGDQTEAFPREVVDDAENAEAPPVVQRVRHKVQRPALVRPLGQEHGGPCAQGPLAAAPAAHLKTFFPV